MLYLQYSNPGGYPPVEHGAHLLARQGFDVRLLGTRMRDDPMHLAPHDRIEAFFRPYEPAGWRQKTHYGRFAAWSVRHAIGWSPDWVYACDPLAAPAALLQHALGLRVIYHEHDAPPLRAASAFMRVVLAARRRLARTADYCIVPNARRARGLSGIAGGREVMTVWNTPALNEVAEAVCECGGDGLLLWYHGSLTPQNFPQSIIHAMALLPSRVSLRAVGYETVGHEGYAAHLGDLCERLRVADRVTFSSPVARRRLMPLCAQADVGLALLPITSTNLNEQGMVGASNKPFDYMAAGLAVLVPDAADWNATYVNPGFGLSCNPRSPGSIRDAVWWLLMHPAERQTMAARGRRQILEQWNYERSFAPVLMRMMAGIGAREGMAASW